jgi:beta-N-acetylhexosaminidase
VTTPHRTTAAAIAVASLVAAMGTATGAPMSQAQPPAPGAQRANAAAPPIAMRTIPYPAARRREMAAYSRMHYGPAYATWRLTPQVIVEHYTATTGAQEVLNTFASDSPDSELGQLPGVCSHYLIDDDGTIMQLVPPTIRCRHTVGLNHVAIGIEMVGMSDGDILGRPRQLASALTLTRYLQDTYAIPTANVIGHSESLSSPLRRELYGPWRAQTHGDWSAASMRTFRARLGASGTAARRP